MDQAGAMELCPPGRRSKITTVGSRPGGAGVMFGGVSKRYDMGAEEYLSEFLR